MRSRIAPVVFLGVSFFLPQADLRAQGDHAPEDCAMPASRAATEEEVEQLRQEVAALKAIILRLAAGESEVASGSARLVSANAIVDSAQPTAPASIPEAPTPPGTSGPSADNTASQKKTMGDPPGAAGWTGEHFRLTSSDGEFTLMPVGYLNGQYSVYKGDGAPPDTFSITRARFGVQGTFGKQVDYAFLFESASAITIRDAFLDFKPWTFFNITSGQFRVPFSHDVLNPDTNYEFNGRSIVSALFPDVTGGYRAPGIEVYGDLAGGHAQYWFGVFNGQGILASGTTNEPEYIGRLRFSPWRQSIHAGLKGFGFGASVEHSRSKALAGELSFNGVLTDGAYTFFPQFRINGGIDRYDGYFTWLSGAMGLRGEYTQILERRDSIGSFNPGGTGFNTLPGVVGKGAYGILTYNLTGENEPEYAVPRVKHPVIGPNSPGENGGPGWGAWQLKLRYSWLEGRALGGACNSTTLPACPLTPSVVPTYSDHTNQITAGVNWYLNYWVLVKLDLDIDQLKNPSVEGILPRNYFVFSTGLQFRF
jgi:hypothetical protein